MVVIAIISLLSTTVMASLNQARQKSRDAKRLSDMKTIQTALELYYNDNNGYPVTGWRSECNGWGSHAAVNVIPGLVPTYIGKMPSDPMMNKTANQNCYIYESVDNGASFKLLDYNCLDCTIATAPSFKDPARNGGSTSCPSNLEPTATWAIWSSPSSMCW